MAGKKCLIFGVANRRSIAWGIAQSLHREGADLVFSYATDRLKENVDTLVDSLPGGEQYPRIRCDVSQPAEVEETFRQIADRWGGKLDVLIHAVAFAKQEDLVGKFTDISWEGYQLAHEISAYSLITCSKYAAPLMEANGGGSIITLTYIASERVIPSYNVMATAKAVLECNVRYLAAELGPMNIRVNAVSAGPIKTLAASAVKGISRLRDHVEEKAPLRRNVEPSDVGDVALFLASDLSRCVTGEIIFADNGFSILGV